MSTIAQHPAHSNNSPNAAGADRNLYIPDGSGVPSPVTAADLIDGPDLFDFSRLMGGGSSSHNGTGDTSPAVPGLCFEVIVRGDEWKKSGRELKMMRFGVIPRYIVNTANQWFHRFETIEDVDLAELEAFVSSRHWVSDKDVRNHGEDEAAAKSAAEIQTTHFRSSRKMRKDVYYSILVEIGLDIICGSYLDETAIGCYRLLRKEALREPLHPDVACELTEWIDSSSWWQPKIRFGNNMQHTFRAPEEFVTRFSTRARELGLYVHHLGTVALAAGVATLEGIREDERKALQDVCHGLHRAFEQRRDELELRLERAREETKRLDRQSEGRP